MKITLRLTVILLVALLAGCGTTEVLRNKNTNTYTVSAQYGALNGSWTRATSEATDKAIAYCESMGQKYYFINEQRTGVVGWSPQASTITFNCGADTVGIIKTLGTECKAAMQNTELDIIRTKVELYRSSNDSAPLFDIATNNTFPNENEKLAIAKWARIREGCISKEDEIITTNQQPLNAMQNAYVDKEREFRKQMTAQASALIVALYQSKLTYGEFAQKRYEIATGIVSAERDFRATTLMQDRDVQMKAQQLAIQQQQNNLSAWNTYMQSVNARQPQTVKIQSNCTSNKFGSTTTTNCN